MNRSYFKTADLDLAATILAAIGAPLVGLDQRRPDQVRFIFNRKDVIDEFVEAYLRGDLRVEPMAFSMIRQYLSGRLNDRIADESIPTGLRI
jgi:hypothetical protein